MGKSRKLAHSLLVASFLLIGCFAPAVDESSPAPAISFYPVEGTPTKLILFVHGLFGDPRATWTNATGESWPDLMRQDKSFRGYAFATIRYDSPLLSRSSGIEEIATRVSRQLDDAGVFTKYNEIFFISHSMGGLIAKRVLTKLDRPQRNQHLRKVKAILYISTPAQGSDRAALVSWISANPQLIDLRPADLNSFLQSVDNDWNDLLRNRGTSFFPRSYCAYETKPTHGTLVVSRVYAADNCDQNRHPVDEDHNSIVKPASVDADIYVWAKARIEEASDLARGTPLRFGIHRTYNYKPGILVDGIEWKEDYREYDLLVRKPSKTASLVDVRIMFHLPWITVGSKISYQQGCEGLAIVGDRDQSFRFGNDKQISKLIKYRTNEILINVNKMFPESTFHTRIVLSTGREHTTDANVNASYRDEGTARKQTTAHRLTVLDASVGTIRIEPEPIKGNYKTSLMMQPDEPISFPARKKAP